MPKRKHRPLATTPQTALPNLRLSIAAAVEAAGYKYAEIGRAVGKTGEAIAPYITGRLESYKALAEIAGAMNAAVVPLLDTGVSPALVRSVMAYGAQVYNVFWPALQSAWATLNYRAMLKPAPHLRASAPYPTLGEFSLSISLSYEAGEVRVMHPAYTEPIFTLPAPAPEGLSAATDAFELLSQYPEL